MPGLYPGGTRHMHVKAQSPGGPMLTTQFHFPGEPANDRDGAFRPRVVTDVLPKGRRPGELGLRESP